MQIPIQRKAIIGQGAIGALLSQMLAADIAVRRDTESEILLIDGGQWVKQTDEYHRRPGYKVDLIAEEIRTIYPNVGVAPINSYIHTSSGPQMLAVTELTQMANVIFAAVDNHASRKLLSDAAEHVDNITLIAGGNDGGHNGMVQVYLRRNGVDLTPPLTAGHPYIANPTDESPADRLLNQQDCHTRISSGVQMMATTLLCAAYMLAAYHTVVELEREGNVHLFPYVDLYINAFTGKTRPSTYSATLLAEATR